VTLRFSANLGFLWAELPLPDAVRAAHRAGFDAVEVHWPYATDPGALRAALEETGLPCLSLNTDKGESFGLGALPDRAAARAAVDRACAYAARIDAQAVHVMAGVPTNWDAPDALAHMEDTLRHGLGVNHDLTLLIEPMNPVDVPGYALPDVASALTLIDRIGDPRVRLMYDCYHAGQRGEDICARLREVQPWLGHVQFAGVPERGVPDHGTVDYAAVFATLEDISWSRPVGAEYRPGGPTENSLGWLKRL
jgi:hydroxypyruvate isomerase